MKQMASRGRRRVAGAIGLAVALSFGLSACGGTGTGTPSAPGSDNGTPTGTITLWHFFTDREADVIQTAVNNFEAKYPGVTVNVVSGQDDDKMRQAIAAGQPIDVGISYSMDQIGVLCSTGAFRDLAPYLAKDNIDLYSQVAAITKSYTQYQGTQCALPMLGDSTGLYFNKDLLAAANITAPPKTLDELADDAVKLTTYNTDGSINQLGFMPLMEYDEINPQGMAPTVQAQWFGPDGKSVVGTDPGWQELYTWQQNLIQRLGGWDKLNTWMAAAGDEFSTQNDFETGRLAMTIDGEWRTAFIASDVPSLNYGTAYLPMATDQSQAYGAGLIDGNEIGIPKGSTNPDLAWLLVKYLALDNDAQVQMGNGLKNVPTLTSALNSPDLEKDANYQIFLDVFQNTNSMIAPITASGTDYQTPMNNFAQDWEQGNQTDLKAGLATVAQQIDAAMVLNG